MTTYTYNDVNNIATVTYPNGVVHTYNYDVNDRLNTMPVTKSGSTLASYTHTFNFAGHKLTASENSGRTATYTYDAVYRLLTETVTGDPQGRNGNVTYSPDPVGNRLSQTSSLTGIISGTFTYDANESSCNRNLRQQRKHSGLRCQDVQL